MRALRSAECRAEFSVLVTNWTVETTRAARFDLFLAQTHTRLAKVPRAEHRGQKIRHRAGVPPRI